MIWVGVDIGGTFTDVIAYDAATRRLRAAKSLSTPSEPICAVLDGLAKLDVDLADVSRFVHGTTRVTNALLEHAGARIAIITTAGFRDVVEMGRGHRHRLYSVKERPAPRLVARALRFEVPERILADGSVRTPLDEHALQTVIEAIRGSDVSGVAVCFLHSYRNPAHEQRAAAVLARLCPGLACSTSAEVVPEIGEYERFATTALNVSVKPFVDDYLSQFEGALKQRGFRQSLDIMTSSGGVVVADEARRVPMQLALSGPAGGVAASAYVADRADFRNVITCDMGGTSTDVCLIKDGQPTMTNQGMIGGFPNRTFQVEINTIGAGGGSLAWIDIGGELCVGPQSAGSTPGPACYGRGGTEPTTTDANLIVGHLDPDELLGGEVRLDVAAARAATARLASRMPTPIDVEDLALGIIQLAVAKMTSAIKEISVARGHDPRDFALMPFGGAGPMHATALAEELGITTVLVPPVPGNLSALGFVTARARHDLVGTTLIDADAAAIGVIAQTFAELEAAALARLAKSGVADPADATLQRAVGMRIKGQSFDVQVPIKATPESIDALIERFRRVYVARYAYMPGATRLEIVNCRLTAFGPQSDVDLTVRSDVPIEPPRTRQVRTRKGWVAAKIVHRPSLAVEDVVAGPAIVHESGATTVIGTGWRARVDRLHNLVVTRDGHG